MIILKLHANFQIILMLACTFGSWQDAGAGWVSQLTIPNPQRIKIQSLKSPLWIFWPNQAYRWIPMTYMNAFGYLVLVGNYVTILSNIWSINPKLSDLIYIIIYNLLCMCPNELKIWQMTKLIILVLMVLFHIGNHHVKVLEAMDIFFDAPIIM